MVEKLPQIGDKQYEMLYSGSKHFWKARCHVEFNIMWHKEIHLIEVANFHIDLHEEGQRIYIDASKIFAEVDKAEVEARVRQKQEELMRQRKPRVMSEELAKTITAQLAVQLIVSRAVIDPNPTEEFKFRVNIQMLSGDPHAEGDVHKLAWLTEAPEGFGPAEIVRKRKVASKAEFAETLDSLRKDSKKLALECNKAARKAGLAKSACAAFVNNKARYTYDPETMSAAKIRFLKAGRRIIALNCVRKITALLERLERKSMGDLPSVTPAEFQQSHDLFGEAGMTSLPSLDSLKSIDANGRRVNRPHHKLKPVRRARRRNTTQESGVLESVPESSNLMNSASTPVIATKQS